MTNASGPPDPLDRAIDALRQPVPIAPGLPGRIASRRRRHQRTRIGASLLAVAALVAVVLSTRPSGTAVTFAITAPSVRSVSLVGDFTDWQSDRVQLHETEAGLWRATIKLPAGRYRFAYLVNQAEWRADSRAASAPDDFGRPTSILTVAEN